MKQADARRIVWERLATTARADADLQTCGDWKRRANKSRATIERRHLKER